ncbi:ABC transporter permease protein [Bacillus sp. TS-2]|nr:ABC transporter permease protein [Bacillus sp. TS-2]
MSNFFQLIKNEQIKLYRLKSTWAMYILLFVIIVGMGLVLKVFNEELVSNTYSDNWQEELRTENEMLLEEIEEFESEEDSFFINLIDYNYDQIEINSYYLDQDIAPPSYDGWAFLLENAGLSSLISLFTIIVGAGMIANEFKWGTIKLLLIRPVSRTKILLSKYLSVLIFALSLLLFLMISSLIIGGLLFGLEGSNPIYMLQTTEGLIESTFLLEILKQFGFNSINLVMMATFAFMISTIFRSSSMAIGIAIFLMFSGNIIVNSLSSYEWSKYILFANTNLNQYFNSYGPIIEGMTLTFSIIVLIVYYVAFLALSWFAFTKRDIAGN